MAICSRIARTLLPPWDSYLDYMQAFYPLKFHITVRFFRAQRAVPWPLDYLCSMHHTSHYVWQSTGGK